MESLNKEENENVGQMLFKYRDYTPIPLILMVILVARPNVLTATFGTLIVILGELIRIYSVAFIGGISRTRSGSLGEELVTSGPFRWVRNPLYCGNFFIVLGLSVFSGSLWFTILSTGLFYFQYYFIIRYEEKILEEKFQEKYREFRLSVPAWLPKKLPKIDEIEWPDSYSAALRSEKRTLASIAAMLILLVMTS